MEEFKSMVRVAAVKFRSEVSQELCHSKALKGSSRDISQ